MIVSLKLSHDGYEPKEMRVSANSGSVVSAQLVKRKVQHTATPRPPDIKTNR